MSGDVIIGLLSATGGVALVFAGIALWQSLDNRSLQKQVGALQLDADKLLNRALNAESQVQALTVQAQKLQDRLSATESERNEAQRKQGETLAAQISTASPDAAAALGNAELRAPLPGPVGADTNLAKPGE